MSWWEQPLTSTGSIADAVFTKMGLDPAGALDQEKSAVAEAIEIAINRLWTHYPWTEILDTENFYITNDLFSIGTNENILEIEGVYTKDPDANPDISSLKFKQVRRKVHVLETAPAMVIARYWPKVPSVTTALFNPSTNSTIEEHIDNSDGALAYGLPQIFQNYIITRSYQEMLIGDGQHEKAGLIAAEAEQILFQEQNKAERRNLTTQL